jgi:flavin-dependent dehydrogenase
MRRTPALIVGGGPAGATVALLLARAGAPHLLIERRPATGDALCGGFLSWRTLETLRGLGIAAEELNPQPVTAVRLFAGERRAEAPLPRPARGVSRHRLDTLLLKRATAAGAAIDYGVTAAAVADRTVTLRGGDELAADALFLATGKHELRGLARPAEALGDDPSLGLRVRLGPSAVLDRLIGDTIELHLFDRGYAGLVRQEDGSVNLCLAVHRSRLTEEGDPVRLLQAIGAELPPLGERLAWWTGDASDAVANVPYGWRASDGAAGLFRLGDQAGVIPSLAGEGVGIALASGVRAAQAYLRGGAAAAADYQRRLARDLARPIGLADLVRHTAEHHRLALWLVRAARTPGAIDLIARLTRIGHSRIDAGSPA